MGSLVRWKLKEEQITDRKTRNIVGDRVDFRLDERLLTGDDGK